MHNIFEKTFEREKEKLGRVYVTHQIQSSLAKIVCLSGLRHAFTTWNITAALPNTLSILFIWLMSETGKLLLSSIQPVTQTMTMLLVRRLQTTVQVQMNEGVMALKNE